jgi:hypothetical protein
VGGAGLLGERAIPSISVDPKTKEDGWRKCSIYSCTLHSVQRGKPPLLRKPLKPPDGKLPKLQSARHKAQGTPVTPLQGSRLKAQGIVFANPALAAGHFLSGEGACRTRGANRVQLAAESRKGR